MMEMQRFPYTQSFSWGRALGASNQSLGEWRFRARSWLFGTEVSRTRLCMFSKSWTTSMTMAYGRPTGQFGPEWRPD